MYVYIFLQVGFKLHQLDNFLLNQYFFTKSNHVCHLLCIDKCIHVRVRVCVRMRMLGPNYTDLIIFLNQYFFTKQNHTRQIFNNLISFTVRCTNLLIFLVNLRIRKTIILRGLKDRQGSSQCLITLIFSKHQGKTL